LQQYINRSGEIYRAAVGILDTLVLLQPIRLLGVRISNLRYESNQLPLFPEERKKALMVHAMDEVNDRYGDFTVTFGSLLNDGQAAAARGSHVISPAWRPSGIRNVDVK
jgi:DNA polymerase-4